jgi:hypothetical protein
MLNILLNILLRVEEGEREERKRKHMMDYIVLSLIYNMNTEAFIYIEAMSNKQVT